MADWCDVFVPDIDERRALETSALFYVPDALAECEARGWNPTSLNAVASAAKQNPTLNGVTHAGKSAITKVLRCEPVIFRSAFNFLNTFNRALEDAGDELRFSSDKVIACVFRLKDARDVLKLLSLSAQDVARGTGLDVNVVVSAFERFRIQQQDAEKIWRHCCGVYHAMGAQGPDALRTVLTGNMSDFLKTDGRAPVAIKKISDDGVERYVYRRGDLVAAPKSGHDWAIN